MNKKGITTIFWFMGVFVIFLIIIGIIVLGIIAGHFNTALQGNIMAGSVNVSNYSDLTIGKINTAVVNNADFWGISTIIGMILGLFLSSYFMRNQYPKVGVILDIAIIFVTFIVSLYLRSIYSSIVTGLNAGGESFAINSLTHTNFFMLNLPIFVTIVGVVMMILFYAGIPSKPEEVNYIPRVVTG